MNPEPNGPIEPTHIQNLRQPPTETIPPPVDTVLIAERYELLEKIAEGGMGVVHRAFDRVLTRDVALKMVKNQDASENTRRRFQEESRITGQLQHPAIPPVHDLGELPDGRPYLAMKLIKGRTLAQMLADRSGNDYASFLPILEQVCQAVAYAHSKEVIHRDLKPANVMVGAFGEVQVMDWGLAKILSSGAGIEREPGNDETQTEVSRISDPRFGSDGSDTLTGSLIGTLAYIPPEQAAGAKSQIDRRSDVFGLGAILCVILTGKPPYVGADLKLQAARGKLGDCLRRLDACGADGELIALAKRCLSPEPVDRPADAGEVARAVAEFRNHAEERARRAELERVRADGEREKAQLQAEAAATLSTLERKKRHWQLGLFASFTVLVFIVGVVAWQVWRQRVQAQARSRETDQKTRLLIDQTRDLLERAWLADDEVGLASARANADRAVELAASGDAGLEVRIEAEEFLQHAAMRIAQASANRRLRDAMHDIVEPRETLTYQRDSRGQLAALPLPAVDEQFARAFRLWGVDPDSDSVESVVSRFKEQPDSFVQEIVTGLDEWNLDRRSRNMSKTDSQRLSDLADALDRNEYRKELRRLRIGNAMQTERAQRAVARALIPLSTLIDAPTGPIGQRLRQLAEQLDPAVEPVQGIVSLSRTLYVAGDVVRAESVLRSGLAARPDSVVLLDAMARLLSQQGPRRLPQVVECYRAMRALRPTLGAKLGLALGHLGRLDEAEAVFHDLERRHPDNPELHIYWGNVLMLNDQWHRASAAYERAIEIKPDYALAYCNLGYARRNGKQLKLAEAACRKAIEINPLLAEAHNNLGIVLIDLRKFADAVKTLQTAIDIRPALAMAHSNLGYVLTEQRKFADAEAACRRALSIDPNLAEAHNNLGIALIGQRRYVGAEVSLRRSLELNPKLAFAWSNLGLAVLQQKRVAEAMPYHQRAIELQPELALGYNNIGMALREQKKYDQALAMFQRALRLQPDLAIAQCNIGTVLRDQKKPLAAVEAFRKAIELDRELAIAHNNLGGLLHELNQSREAEALLRRAIELDPHDAQAYANLGNLLHDKPDLPAAEAACRRAIELQPDLAMAYNNLGLILGDRNKPKEAEAAFRKAIELDPNDGGAYSNLGSLLDELGRPAQAEPYFRKASELDPSRPEPFHNVGNALKNQGKLEEAERAYRRALGLQPNLAPSLFALGVVLYRQNKKEEALTVWRKAAALTPKDAELHYNIGNVLGDLGRHEEAVAAFREAININPRNASAYVNLSIDLMRLKRQEEAIAAIRIAIAIRPGDAKQHWLLGMELREIARFDEALAAFQQADKLNPNDSSTQKSLAETMRLRNLARRIPDIRAGRDTPKDAKESLEIGAHCLSPFVREYALAYRLHLDAFTRDAKLLPENRYNAVCAMLCFAAGNDDRAAPTLEEWFHLQQKAREWLAADLAIILALPDRRLIAAKLNHWLADSDLASVRHPKRLAAMPEAQRKAWEDFWANVRADLAKAMK